MEVTWALLFLVCATANVVSGQPLFFKSGEQTNCPGGKTVCPSGKTCCPVSVTEYGCCPLPAAVCCDDFKHCCPNGTTCDVTRRACTKGDVTLPWYNHEPALQLEGDNSVMPEKIGRAVRVSSVVCPDSSYCPYFHTCCINSAGGYSCCPHRYAVCCPDERHCCPSGMTCDDPAGKCNRGDVHIDWFEKRPAIQLQDVRCDATHKCPSDNTCCMLATGEWGCCPLPIAVCCSDQIHCCPSGTTCDVSAGKCIKGDVHIDWFEKRPAIQLQDVRCDATHKCPSDNTCCMLATGEWGCCPLPIAVCCSDQIHCCPSGTTCDVSAGKCIKGDVHIDWFEKRPAIQLQDVRCDATHKCPSDNTCCMLATGEWGCCPLPIAVCCSDQIHCCPSGTTCDVSAGKCIKGDVHIDWFEKRPAI